MKALSTALLIVICQWLAGPLAAEPRGPGEHARLAADCGCAGSPNRLIVDLLQAYPLGGAPLADGVTKALLTDALSIDDILCAMRRIEGQRVIDVADGVVAAMMVESRTREAHVREQIGQIRCADAGLRAAFYAARAISVFATGLGATRPPLMPVSPSRP